MKNSLLSATRVAICCILLAACISSQSYGADITNVGSFLDLGMGARPLALGCAFVAVADDPNSLMFNPAGLFNVSGIDVASSYETRLHAFEYGYVAAVSRGVGISISYFDFGVIPETDRNGNPVGLFSYQDVALLAGATVVHGYVPAVGTWSVGFTGKLVRMGAGFSADAGRGGAIDVGFLVSQEDIKIPLFLSGYSFGVVLENLMTTDITWGLERYTEDWPTNFVLGASLVFVESILVAVESDFARGVSVGIEVTPVSQLAIRGGFRHEGVPIWSLGLGFSLPRFSLDYAVVFHPYLTEEHRLTFSVHLR